MIIEMRTYLLKPGTVPAFMERFAEGLPARIQFSKLGGIWHTEVGTLNQVVHVWPYESLEDRERIGQAARKTGKWPPNTHEFIILQENKIIKRRKIWQHLRNPHLHLCAGRNAHSAGALWKGDARAR